MAKVHYFLKFSNGIKGESCDCEHRDEIELESWSWGENLRVMGDVASFEFDDFVFTTLANVASPRLAQACAAAKIIKEARLACCLLGDQARQEFMTVRFTDCMVRSVHTSASAGAIPTDQLSLSYATVQYEYRPLQADGSLGEPVHFGWNLVEHHQI